jgi:hypothetical protein
MKSYTTGLDAILVLVIQLTDLGCEFTDFVALQTLTLQQRSTLATKKINQST